MFLWKHSDCNVICPQMFPECRRQTRRENVWCRLPVTLSGSCWTLSQLCHIASMWTHCLRHQLVASTFAVSARVRRTSCCHPVQGRSVTLQVASQLSIFFWLCPDAFIKRLTATTHSAFLFKFLFIHFFYFFTETILVVQFLCMYILGKKRE